MANNQLLASDNFASGSLAAGWSQWATLTKGQVVLGTPNVVEPNTPGTAAGQLWTGLNWPSDQTSEVVINNLSGDNTNTVGLVVRGAPASLSGYLAIFNAVGTLVVFKIVNGTTTALGTMVSSLTYAAGDVLTFQAAGCGLTVYKNGARIYYFYDTTFPSGGYPGFDQNSSTSTSHSQVSSWRGYSCNQQDGVWQKQGVVIAPILIDLDQATAGVGIQSGNVIFDGNAQLLSGNVYKTWLVSDWSNDTASAIYYAESVDGINWTRSASPVLTGVTNGIVTKVGSTYYMYGQASGASGPGLNVYPIAAVNAINVLTGTGPNGFSPQITQAPGIGAVIDLRPITQTNFSF